MAVSPDGQNVYVVSNSDDVIVTFDRAPDGALSNPSCIEDVPEPPAVAVCGSTAQGLDSARAVTVSSDGASVYALGNVDDALVRFDQAQMEHCPTRAVSPIRLIWPAAAR